MHAIQLREHGGPDVLEYVEKTEPRPSTGEVLVRLSAVGVNFIDVYHRTGLYKVPLPFTPGQEGAGTVVEVGPEVTAVKVGDRVAYTGVAGSYSEMVVAPAHRLVKLPEGVSFEQGAAAMLQGMTAHYLATSTFPLKPGDLALVHAGAGGVGLLLIQMAKIRNATVIATVSTEEKAALARGAGADHVILYSQKDFYEETMAFTGKSGVDVVYDSVGKDTFDRSLKCLKPRGYLVLFGQSSGKVPPVDPQVLNIGGSLFLTRPTLNDYIADRASLDARAEEVFRWVAQKKLTLRVGATFPLSQASTAHTMLESRKTTGKVLLVPGT